MRGCHGIATEDTALAENIRRFKNGTVVPQRNPQALAEAVINILKNPPSIQEQEATRQNIRNYMSPLSVAHKHEALYKELTQHDDMLDCCGMPRNDDVLDRFGIPRYDEKW